MRGGDVPCLRAGRAEWLAGERGIEEVRRTGERGMFEEDQVGGCRGAAWRWVYGDDIKREDKPI